jgi:uncharacterized protein (DUF362 family)
MLADAECVVQTCCLKTHGFGGHFTMSLKNSVGFVPYSGVFEGVACQFMDELHTSAHQRSMIAEINTAYTPALIVMDGVEAFTTGGPAEGSKVEPGIVVAGTDRVAVDAVGVAILRMFGTTSAVQQGSVFEQEQIARAAELGLGVASPAGIEFVTDDDASAAFAAHIRGLLLS